MKKQIFIAEGILQFFIALGAIVVGVLMIVNPAGDDTAVPMSLLDGSPFKGFLIPGIILLTVNGLGNLFAGILSFRRHKLSGWTGIFFGFALIIWIFVQVSMIGGGHWLQILYFILGIIELILGILIRETSHS